MTSPETNPTPQAATAGAPAVPRVIDLAENALATLDLTDAERGWLRSEIKTLLEQPNADLLKKAIMRVAKDPAKYSRAATALKVCCDALLFDWKRIAKQEPSSAQIYAAVVQYSSKFADVFYQAVQAEAGSPAATDIINLVNSVVPGASGKPRAVTAQAAGESADASEVALPVTPNSTGRDTAGERRFDSVHIYGKGFAACFEAETTRDGEPTVAVDIAAVPQGSRVPDWKHKLRIQLTPKELVPVLGVFLRRIPAYANERTAYGVKSFSFEAQPAKVYLSVSGEGVGKGGVPITAGDLFRVQSLLVRQIKQGNAHLGDAWLAHLTDSVFQFMVESPGRKTRVTPAQPAT